MEAESTYAFFPLTGEDFTSAIQLWESEEGVVLRVEDHQPTAFERFLMRNPKLSWGAWRGSSLIGAVMAGQDGRRGHVYHLAVAADARRQGIGRRLVAQVEGELIAQGIQKVHAHVVIRNLRAQLFWQKVGWNERDDLLLFSRQIGTS